MNALVVVIKYIVYSYWVFYLFCLTPFFFISAYETDNWNGLGGTNFMKCNNNGFDLVQQRL